MQQSLLHDMTLVQAAHGVHSVLTLATNFVPSIQNITTGHEDPVDPILHKEMNLVQDLLAQNASAEVSFTLYLSNAQKQKIVKVTYQTRSKDPSLSPPCLPNYRFSYDLYCLFSFSAFFRRVLA